MEIRTLRIYLLSIATLAAATPRFYPSPAFGQAPASSQSQSTTEYIQRLKRFHVIASVIGEPSDASKNIARPLAAALDNEVQQHPEKRELLAYYLAKAYDISGDSKMVVQWAASVAKDLEDPNCAEARGLLV